MKARDAYMAWTPDNGLYDNKIYRGQMMVGEKWIVQTKESMDHPLWDSVIPHEVRDSNEYHVWAFVMTQFHTLCVRDGLLPLLVHNFFLEIDEYRERISPDILGAD